MLVGHRAGFGEFMGENFEWEISNEDNWRILRGFFSENLRNFSDLVKVFLGF